MSNTELKPAIVIAGTKEYRMELAKRLAPLYAIDEFRLGIAVACDDVLDTSGALLGWVRDEVIKDWKNTRIDE